MEIGLIMFVIFGAFFEIIFSFGVSEGWRTFMFPIALLILGSYLVFKQLGLNTRKDKIEQNQPDVVVPPPSPDAE